MGVIRVLALLSGAFAELVVSGCASDMTAQDERAIGHPEIVYFQPDANLAAYDRGGTFVYITEFALGGAIALAGGAAAAASANTSQKSALFVHAAEIQKLGFDDQVHSMFIAAVTDAAWLPDKQIKVVRGVEDGAGYMRGSGAESMIYLKPRFLMSSDSREFIIDVFVEVRVMDTRDTNRVVHTLREKEFRFTHELSLVKPGMSWNEQKAAAHVMAAMDSHSAAQLWFDNDAALLRSYYSQDFPQIQVGLRRFFDDRAEAPAR